MIPPVGKSGAFICSIISIKEISGFAKRALSPFIISVGLCGGIFVAIPTAIPDEPFISKFGTRVGITSGSFVVPS